MPTQPATVVMDGTNSFSITIFCCNLIHFNQFGRFANLDWMHYYLNV